MTEDLLRDALGREPGAPPSADAWAGVQRRAAARRARRRQLSTGGGVAAAVAVVAGLVVGTSGGDDPARRVTAGPSPTASIPPEVAAPRPAAAVVVTGDGRLVVLDTATGEEVRQLDDVARFPLPEGGGRQLFVEQVAGGEVLYRAVSGTEAESTASIWRVGLFGGESQQLAVDAVSPALSPDGARLAYLTGEELVVRDLASGDERRFAEVPDTVAVEVEWDPTGARLAFTQGVERSPLELWVLDVDSASDLGDATPLPGGSVGSLTWVESGEIVAVDGTMAVVAIDPDTNERRPLLEHDDAIWHAAADASGQHVVVVDEEGAWMYPGRTPLGDGISSAAWATVEPAPTDGARPPLAVATSGQGRVVVLDTSTGEAIRTLYAAPPGAVLGSVSLSADGSTAWFDIVRPDLDSAECVPTQIWRVPVAGGEAEQIALGAAPAPSPDGRFVAYGAVDPRVTEVGNCAQSVVTILDLATGEERRWTPEQHDSFETLATIGRLAWSPDGRRLAFDHRYEGSSVYVLDATGPGGTLADATFLQPRGQDDLESFDQPTFVSNDDLVVHGWCCYADGDPAERVLWVDLSTGEVRDRLDVERPPIDVTSTPDGELLYLDADGTLFVVDDGPPEVLGRGFVDAAW